MSKFVLLCIHCLLVTLWLPSLSAGWHDKKAEGWAWYEDRKVETAEEKASSKSFSEEIQEIRKDLEEKLSRAILNPTDENVMAYMQEQMKWVEKSSEFASIWAHLLLNNPHLDHSITGRPVSQYGLQLHKAQKIEQRELLITSLAKNRGLMLFYEGRNPVSLFVADVVQEFSEKYGWEVLNISVDGEILDLPNSKRDNGISEKMGLEVFPALVVVDPKENRVTPVAFGLFSADRIEENLEIQFRENVN